MQELRLIAVSEDGSFAILDVPGRGGRYALPIDDRLRTVARGQFSRLAQYEIEVESPLRPKEIQDRIRAGEKADEIADAAGVPIERVRRFEGPVLAEREFRAQEAQRVTVRSYGDGGPGPRLGDIVAERLAEFGASTDDTRWDSFKRPDGNWQVLLEYSARSGQHQLAEWVFDPRSRHVSPTDDEAIRLCLPRSEWPAPPPGSRVPATATVTPIGSRLPHPQPPEPGPGQDRQAGRAAAQAEAQAAAAAGHARSVHPAAAGSTRSGPSGPSGPAMIPEQARGARAAAPETANAQLQAPGARPQAQDAQPQARDAQPQTTPAAAARGAQPPGQEAAGSRPQGRGQESAGPQARAAAEQAPGVPPQQPPGQADAPQPDRPAGRSARRAAGRSRRASVPSWDEIMFGNTRQHD